METQQVELVIRSPSSTAPDFRIDLSISSSVGELKEILNKNYPNNPLPSQQKLIFAGKLLSDEQLIGDVLRQYDINSPQTIHIVISKTSPSSPSPNFIRQNPIGLNPIPRVENVRGPVNFAQNANNNNNNNNNNNGVARQNQENEEGQSSIWLFLKLLLLVYIFSSGGSGTAGTIRTIAITIGALFIFLFQTGRLRFGANNVNTRNEGTNGQEVNGVNRNYGLLSEITGILIPLVYSLLPTWQPNSSNNAAVHVPPAADPNPNPNPNNANNNNPQNVDINDIPAQ